MLLLLLYQLPWPWHPPSYNPMVYRHPSPKPLLSFEYVLFSSFDNKWALWLLDVFSSYRKSVLMRSRIKPNCRLIHVPLYINRHAACLKSTHKTLFDSQKENTSTTDYYYYYGCCVLFLSFFFYYDPPYIETTFLGLGPRAFYRQTTVHVGTHSRFNSTEIKTNNNKEK